MSIFNPLHLKEKYMIAMGNWGSRALGNFRREHPQKGAFAYGQIKVIGHLGPKPELLQ